MPLTALERGARSAVRRGAFVPTLSDLVPLQVQDIPTVSLVSQYGTRDLILCVPARLD